MLVNIATGISNPPSPAGPDNPALHAPFLMRGGQPFFNQILGPSGANGASLPLPTPGYMLSYGSTELVAQRPSSLSPELAEQLARISVMKPGDAAGAALLTSKTDSCVGGALQTASLQTDQQQQGQNGGPEQMDAQPQQPEGNKEAAQGEQQQPQQERSEDVVQGEQQQQAQGEQQQQQQHEGQAKEEGQQKESKAAAEPHGEGAPQEPETMDVDQVGALS